MLSLTVPAYNSRPGAAQSLYIDFDGSAPFTWNNKTAPFPGYYQVRGPGSSFFAPTPVQAFSTDGDFNNFSTAELDTIKHIWSWVSEKFSPFTINVTTVNPGFVQDSRTMTCLVAGSNSDWYTGSGGGTSDIDGFEDGGENTCFVFSADAVNNGLAGGRLEQFLGDSIAHEAGHEASLKHQRTPGSEYYGGDSTRAPIMGGASNNTTGARGIWWETNNWPGQNSGDPQQFDLEMLTASAPDRLQFAGDFDGSNLSFNTAGKLNTVTGLINDIFDVDGFGFDATGTHATFTVKNWQYGGMLAPTVRIRISSTNNYVSGTIVTANTSASIDTNNLVPGQHYFVEVGSQGQYGDIGQYTIDGSQTVFAAYDAASRTINVGGFVGNNNIHMFTSAGVLTIQDSVNGGSTASQNFTTSLVDSISINLGAGDDVVNWNGLFKSTSPDNPIPVYTSLGGGFDTLKLGNSSSFENFTVDQYVIDGAFGGHHSTIWDFDAEKLELDGTSDNDTFNINSQNSYSTIWIYGGFGNDSLYLSPQVVGTSDPVVIFHGEQGTDTATIEGSTLTAQQQFIFFNNTLQRYIPDNPFAQETQFDTTVERITIRGGAGDDAFHVLSEVAGQFISAQGYGGDDTFVLGESNINFPPVFQHPFSANIFGTVQVLGATGNDSLRIDDLAWSGGVSPSYTISGSSFSGGTGFGGNATISYDVGLDNFEFDASNSRAGTVTLQGVPAVPAMKLVGGAGTFDVLTVDDRSLTTVPFRVDLGADYYREYYGTIGAPDIRQPVISGFEQFKLNSHNSTNTINVFAVPTGQSTSITTGVNADTVTVYPHDDNGQPTINAGLSVSTGGGSDKLVIDDSASNLPIDYVFTNTFAGLIDQINGLGTGALAPLSDVEVVSIQAGGGDDTFDFNQHKLTSGVALYGGDGNDVLNIGAGNPAANIANLSSFLFDGQGGSNTVNLNNESDPNQWIYTSTRTAILSTAGSIQAERVGGAPDYVFFANLANTAQLTLNTGTGTNVLSASGVPLGETVRFNGNGTTSAINFSNPSQINGPIDFHAGPGTNNINNLSNGSASPIMAHLTPNSFGAFPGDNYFPAGGALFFDSPTNIVLTMGSGEDTVYAQPNATATVSIRGGNPTSDPGDTINLALAAAQNYVVNGTAASGNVTSDNLKTLSFSGFETGPNVDDVAPAIVAADINLDGIPAAGAARGGTRTRTPIRQQTLDVNFSEDVSALITPASIQLTNLTTGEPVPTANIAVTFDTATNTAHFAFPGYPNGVLPDGNYHGSVFAGLPDSFGNALQADAPFDFFFLSGDANHDRMVDVTDLGILATSWQTSDKLFSEGDFNYDGVVDVSDLGILATNWQQTLPPVAGAAAAQPKTGKLSKSPKAISLTGLDHEANDVVTLAAPAANGTAID